VNIYVAGCGALGSQIAMHLALNDDVTFILIDNDRVGSENIGTSAYDRHQVNMMKATALSELLWLRGCAFTEPQVRFIDHSLVVNHEHLIIDTFDNISARECTCGMSTIHVGVSVDRTGIILWDDSYTLPEEQEGGNPVCFPAGTMILSEKGYIPIEEIEVGDRVLTHRLRWKRVTETHSSIGDTVIIKGHGHLGLEVTHNHPFYIKERGKRIRVGPERHSEYIWGEPKWIMASNLRGGMFWASPAQIPPLPIPKIGGRGLKFTPMFWWYIGHWLAEGCFAGNGQLMSYCAHKESDTIEKILYPLNGEAWKTGGEELHFRRNDRPYGTAASFTTAHKGLIRWVDENFSHGARFKRLPGWVYGMKEYKRRALLSGYLMGDGYWMENRGGCSLPRQTCQTVSRALAFSIRTLATTLGYSVSVHDRTPIKDTILGRRVNISPAYGIAWTPRAKLKHTYFVDGLAWSRIRSVKEGRRAIEVFNLSVKDDESYVVEGIVVHNCTHLLGRRILRLTATYAANVIERWLETGEKRNALVTEKDVVRL